MLTQYEIELLTGIIEDAVIAKEINGLQVPDYYHSIRDRLIALNANAARANS